MKALELRRPDGDDPSVSVRVSAKGDQGGTRRKCIEGIEAPCLLPSLHNILRGCISLFRACGFVLIQCWGFVIYHCRIEIYALCFSLLLFFLHFCCTWRNVIRVRVSFNINACNTFGSVGWAGFYFIETKLQRLKGPHFLCSYSKNLYKWLKHIYYC